MITYHETKTLTRIILGTTIGVVFGMEIHDLLNRMTIIHKMLIIGIMAIAIIAYRFFGFALKCLASDAVKG